MTTKEELVQWMNNAITKLESNISNDQSQTMTENKEEQLIEDDNQDKQDIFDLFDRIHERGISDPLEFKWKFMNYKYKNNKNINEKKENENKKIKKNIKISQLTKENKPEMCNLGHSYFRGDEEHIKDSKCIKCGSMTERQSCIDCAWYEADKTGKDKEEFYPLHVYCKACRINNAKRIRNIIKINKIKSEIIRNELLANPSLEMDVLCNMPRKASVDELIKDINKLQPAKRSQWCLWLFDIDHLKAWNTAIGHPRTDLLIKSIGNVFHKYVNEINNNKWNNREGGWLKQSYIFRPGGDEFVMVVKNTYPYKSSLGSFYYSLRKDINSLGGEEHMKYLFSNDEKELEEAKKELKKAKDREGNPIDMHIVGISTGLYVPCNRYSNAIKSSDWYELGDKKALEHAKTIYLPKKNGISIYYEEISSLINDKKIKKCLEMGIRDGLK